MKKNLLFAFILSVVSVSAYSQVQSTTFGGLWHDPNTWIGLTVPGENDDVIINGPVVQAYTSGYAILPVHCNNLTITSSGSLRNGGYGGGMEFSRFMYMEALSIMVSLRTAERML